MTKDDEALRVHVQGILENKLAGWAENTLRPALAEFKNNPKMMSEASTRTIQEAAQVAYVRARRSHIRGKQSCCEAPGESVHSLLMRGAPGRRQWQWLLPRCPRAVATRRRSGSQRRSLRWRCPQSSTMRGVLPVQWSSFDARVHMSSVVAAAECLS